MESTSSSAATSAASENASPSAPSGAQATLSAEPKPTGDLAGLTRYWKADLQSGFIVFLIALPLCLGISLACGYPPIAGIFTASIGGLIATFVSDAPLAIKGPAAGLIVIAVGCINDFGGNGFLDGTWSAEDQHAYRLALGVGVAAAAAQIVFGLLRGGVLGGFFPSAAVHGMLAAIGVIIMGKQIPVAVGVTAKGSPLELLARIPSELMHANPAIALIGGLSLAIMFLWPLIQQPQLRRVPAPMVVVLTSVPLGLWLGLDTAAPHTYTLGGHEYSLGRSFLVNVPSSLFGAVTTPDFSGLSQAKGWYWVMMFAVIGTLESLLSAKAVDMLDPYKRKTHLDRDNIAIGAGNLLASLVGGLPMISEIVRSRANIDNGARTRFSNFFHGLFLLAFVAAIPKLISLIPLSALAAMLVYTGFRLAHPREFVHVYHIGVEQLVVFCATLCAVLATDLLEGIAIGIGVKLVIHVINGAPLLSFLRPSLVVERNADGAMLVRVQRAAIFSNWIALEKRLHRTEGAQQVVVDLSEARLVDHTVMTKLHDLQGDFARRGCSLVITGLHEHKPLSRHPHATRKLVART